MAYELGSDASSDSFSDSGPLSEVHIKCNHARPNGGTDDLVGSLTEHLIREGRVSHVVTYDSKIVLDASEGYLDDGERVAYEVEWNDDAHMDLTLRSRHVGVADMLNTLQSVHDKRENLPANQLFYFQQKYVPDRQAGHRMEAPNPALKYANAPARLSFQRRSFHTNKTFASLHGGPVSKVKDRMTFFRDHQEWYDARGVPYQLGMLFTGRPGCGKSSVVKAMAVALRRHIVSLDMSAILTTVQLHALFYDDTLTDTSTGDSRSVRVPQDRRLYVIEEADKAGGVLLAGTSGTKHHESQLSLRDVLDVLDGGVESPGRVMILTANDPEKLHKYAKRAGRVDFVVDFGPVDAEMLADIYRRLCDRTASAPLPGAGVLTPAEVTEAVLATLNGGEDATRRVLTELCSQAQARSTGGSTGGSTDGPAGGASSGDTGCGSPPVGAPQ